MGHPPSDYDSIKIPYPKPDRGFIDIILRLD